VDVVLTRHDHVYERFGPMDAGGAADVSDLRQFVISSGRAESELRLRRLRAEQRSPESDVPGIGVFELVADGYVWSFCGTDRTIRDSSKGVLRQRAG
jgi:hypothetical protein